VVSFEARTGGAAADTDRRLCVDSGHGGDVIKKDGECDKQKFAFAVPGESVGHAAAYGHKRLNICVDEGAVEVGERCETGGTGVRFNAPSIAEIAASTMSVEKAPYYTLVEEDVRCFPFLCKTLEATLGLS